MKVVSKRLLKGIAAAAFAAALIVPSAGFAAGAPLPGKGHGGGGTGGGGGGGGTGGGGGGGGGETTVANSLSVPTIMVGAAFTGVTCPTGTTPGALIVPTGLPRTGYPIAPANYYYVQGVNAWQAQCYTASGATVTAAWGDNLTGDAAKTVGHPIRVELGLFDTTGVTMNGYTVVKLDPNALDRESAYGTLATPDGTGGFTATASAFMPVRVYDPGVTFSIQNVATGVYLVVPGTKATAEINATGAIVYGYNLRVTTAGNYVITFTTSSGVTFTGTDAGTVTPNSASLTISIGGGGGGGSGGSGGHGKH